MEENAMYIMWQKLRKLHHVIKDKIRPFNGIKSKLIKLDDLTKAQQNLVLDRMNITKIERTKDLSIEIIKLCNIEEQFLRKKAKIQ